MRSFTLPFVSLLVAIICCGCFPPPRGTGTQSQPSGVEPGRSEGGTDVTRVRWLRIHGSEDESSPPILRLGGEGRPLSSIGSSSLTMTLDIVAQSMPNLMLVLVHCDRDWVPTQSIFVQDIMRLRSTDFDLARAPIGVSLYDYTASITFPRPDGSLRIAYSGNYLARVVDYYDNERVIAEARFFVVEQKAAVVIDLFSDFYSSPLTEVVQNGLRARVEATPASDLFASQLRAIHLYRNGEWTRPMSAGYDEPNQSALPGQVGTRWNAFLGGKANAEFSNIPAGNEHRLLDLTDMGLYPTTGTILTTSLSDLPRRSFNEYDNDGVAISRFVQLRDADYVYFEFRLDLAGSEVKQDIFVVGTFNNWIPTAEWRMFYNKESGYYIARGLIRRALHEYQYVAGDWDEDNGVLRNEDASLLEGNTSQSTSRFYALVYYRDLTSGGFDRIVGVGTTGGIR